MFKILKDAIVGNVPFYILMSVSVILLVISFFLPPTGEINSSVMAGVGELFAWGGLWAVIKAIDKGTKATIQHGQTSITVNDEEAQN